MMWMNLLLACLFLSTASASLRGTRQAAERNGYEFEIELALDGDSTPCTPSEEVEVRTMLWALVDTWIPIEMGKLDPKHPDLTVVKLDCANCSKDSKEKRSKGGRSKGKRSKKGKGKRSKKGKDGRQMKEEELHVEETTAEREDLDEKHRRLPKSWRYSGRTRCSRLTFCDSGDKGRFRRGADLEEAVAAQVVEEFQVFLDSKDDFCMQGHVDLAFSLQV